MHLIEQLSLQKLKMACQLKIHIECFNYFAWKGMNHSSPTYGLDSRADFGDNQPRRKTELKSNLKRDGSRQAILLLDTPTAAMATVNVPNGLWHLCLWCESQLRVRGDSMIFIRHLYGCRSSPSPWLLPPLAAFFYVFH